jgi:hypothetical protein
MPLDKLGIPLPGAMVAIHIELDTLAQDIVGVVNDSMNLYDNNLQVVPSDFAVGLYVAFPRVDVCTIYLSLPLQVPFVSLLIFPFPSYLFHPKPQFAELQPLLQHQTRNPVPL